MAMYDNLSLDQPVEAWHMEPIFDGLPFGAPNSALLSWDPTGALARSDARTCCGV